jgi:hypothetical protein
MSEDGMLDNNWISGYWILDNNWIVLVPMSQCRLGCVGDDGEMFSNGNAGLRGLNLKVGTLKRLKSLSILKACHQDI